MPILIISDIHANLTALDAVLEDAREVEAVWCLGDVVGYGPDPNECVARVHDLPNLICLLGNHDAAAIGQISLDTFNPEARYSIEWLQSQLTPESLGYLNSRPTRQIMGEVTLVHGSPRSPIYEYLLDAFMASQNFSHFDTDFCFVGHTHLPVVFHAPNGAQLARLTVPKANTGMRLYPRAILNPGSVGQPRDRDPRAAYALFDPEGRTWEHRRVVYDIEAVQARMTAAALPDRHIQRLEIGW